MPPPPVSAAAAGGGGGVVGRGFAAAGVQPLPVSAVAVGAAPDRAAGAAGGPPTGADIVEDAMAEQKVAWRARDFMATGDADRLRGPPPRSA